MEKSIDMRNAIALPKNDAKRNNITTVGISSSLPSATGSKRVDVPSLLDIQRSDAGV